MLTDAVRGFPGHEDLIQQIYKDLRHCGRMDQWATLSRIARPSFCWPRDIGLHVIETIFVPELRILAT